MLSAMPSSFYSSHLQTTGIHLFLFFDSVVLVYNKAGLNKRKRTYNHHVMGVVMGVGSTERKKKKKRIEKEILLLVVYSCSF